MQRSPRRLILVLGDQLAEDHPAVASMDRTRDLVLMIESRGEAVHVWSHKARIAIFLAAMRHRRDAWLAAGVPLRYLALEDAAAEGDTLVGRLQAELRELQPRALVLLEPGEWRLERAIREVAEAAGVDLEQLPDPHFMCSRDDFVRWASRSKAGSLRMEFFYREQRRQHEVLMEADGTPAGGQWNFDADNRAAFPKTGPGEIPPPARFEPDATTREVLALVEREFAEHPGSLASFGWAVTRADALVALERFVETRLASFGRYQDAMWSDTPWGWHSLLSSSLNLHLLDPREVIAAAERAWREGRAPLEGVEGFVRQILGWREFIRGVYWLEMPRLAEANHYGHRRALPAWYWTGKTRMACLADAIGQTLAHGYAHHIQRLMVTGLFALLAEVEPKQVADWYLAVYVDAIEWVELPNVAGMTLFADGGRFTSKPYIASGAYIDRQSNHCRHCPYSPKLRSGNDACPFTVLYWRFVDRHEKALLGNPRTVFMAKNLARLSSEQRQAIRSESERVLAQIESL
ncbi:MAG TPA: cryptochrome/photolyase family protein [Methylibium sp.]|uniref:cryptochrome/photolyase family protein n=1 Tax=Methylibium sp. TaxID=2067992 RepID=UPI002DBDE407|nr:cryptochrome/photolyase family protein [Methylibium sp.]HEU4460424.1 cryptochrome/photolyase family protein [Methylibium sp.]